VASATRHEVDLDGTFREFLSTSESSELLIVLRFKRRSILLCKTSDLLAMKLFLQVLGVSRDCAAFYAIYSAIF